MFTVGRARLSLLTIIMSSELPETNRIRKRKLSSLLHSSRAPTPSSIEIDSSSDNPTRRVTKILFPTFYWNSLALFSTSPLNKVPVAGVDHAPTTAFATEAYTLSPGSPISVPVSGSIPVQFGSASGQGLETPPTVSGHAVHTIFVADYWSFRICLWPPIDCYRPRCLMP